MDTVLLRFSSILWVLACSSLTSTQNKLYKWHSPEEAWWPKMETRRHLRQTTRVVPLCLDLCRVDKQRAGCRKSILKALLNLECSYRNNDVLKWAPNYFNGRLLRMTCYYRELLDSTWLIKLHLLWWAICVALIKSIMGEREMVAALYTTIVACCSWLLKGNSTNSTNQSLFPGLWGFYHFCGSRGSFKWRHLSQNWLGLQTISLKMTRNTNSLIGEISLLISMLKAQSYEIPIFWTSFNKDFLTTRPT